MGHAGRRHSRIGGSVDGDRWLPPLVIEERKFRPRPGHAEPVPSLKTGMGCRVTAQVGPRPSTPVSTPGKSANRVTTNTVGSCGSGAPLS